MKLSYNLNIFYIILVTCQDNSYNGSQFQNKLFGAFEKRVPCFKPLLNIPSAFLPTNHPVPEPKTGSGHRTITVNEQELTIRATWHQDTNSANKNYPPHNKLHMDHVLGRQSTCGFP